MPQISVIVPIYKAEAYLRRCVDSILAQTFTDFELILVDDGSPDGCPGICDDYREKDARVRVIHKKNGGVSAARNDGIEAAEGEWITFVDADDEIFPNYLETLTKCSSSDMPICSFIRAKGEEYYYHIIDECVVDFTNCSDYNKSVLFKMCKYLLLYGPYNRLFRKSIIDKFDLKFDLNMSYGEDLCFVFTYLNYCENISYTPKALYIYYNNEDSLVHNVKSDKLELNIKLNQKVYDFADKIDYLSIELLELLSTRVFDYYYDRALEILNDLNTSKTEKLAALKKIMSYDALDWVCKYSKNKWFNKKYYNCLISRDAEKLYKVYFKSPAKTIRTLLGDKLYQNIRKILKK